jgi:hypothetical protein
VNGGDVTCIAKAFESRAIRLIRALTALASRFISVARDYFLLRLPTLPGRKSFEDNEARFYGTSDATNRQRHAHLQYGSDVCLVHVGPPLALVGRLSLQTVTNKSQDEEQSKCLSYADRGL